LNIDAYRLMHRVETTPAEIEYLHKAIPNSDVTIQMSGNGSPMLATLQIDSKFGMNFFEPTGSRKLVEAMFPDAAGRSPVLSFQSGADGAGYYLDNNPPSQSQFREQAAEWLASKGESLQPETKLAFSYTKEVEAGQLYVDALAKVARASREPYILVTKDFETLNVSRLPGNVRVVKIGGIPDYVMRSLNGGADLAPMLTGDVSLSLGISYANERRTFFYEAPPWKVGASWLMQEDLERASPQNKERIAGLFLRATELASMKRADRTKAVNTIAGILTDSKFQSEMYQAIQKNKSSWNVLRNIESIYGLARLFQTEIETSHTYTQLLDLVMSRLFLKSSAERRTWARGKLKGTDTSLEDSYQAEKVDRVVAGLYLLKAGERLTIPETRMFLKAASDTANYDAFTALKINVERDNVREVLETGGRMRNKYIRESAREQFNADMLGVKGCGKLLIK
ncbi:MAG: hypothetical protein ABL958_11860, partial [Bdellovibrionia bacterium]